MMEMNKIHLLDCMEGMKHFPDNYFDLAIVDVPYGIKEDGRKTKGRNIRKDGSFIPKKIGDKTIIVKPKDYKLGEWDSNTPEKEYFTELKRVSKNQIIWGANHLGEMPSSSCWIVWDKKNGYNDFADAELAYTSFKSAVRIFSWKWAGMLQEDMKNKEHRIHPTQKPVQLYKWLLRNYAEKDFKILDTHVGSGSSIIAFEHFGCEWIGFEIDKDYYDAANKRIKNELAQVRLF